MKKLNLILPTLVLSLSVFLFGLPSPAAAEEKVQAEAPADQVVDRVVAIVGTDAITWSDLNMEGQDLFRIITQKAPPNELAEAMSKAREEVLSGLIEKTIVRQQAAKLNVDVTDEEVATSIDNIIKRNNTTPEAMWKELAAMGRTEEGFRKSIKEQILEQKLLNYEIRSRLVITEEKAKEYYDTTYGKETGEGYHLLQIGILKSKGVSSNEPRVQAEKIRQLAAENNNFEELARAYSELASGTDGGDIGIFKLDEMTKQMRDIVLALKPGEVSPVVDTETGYQLFKLLSVKKDGVFTMAPFATVRQEITDRLYQDEIEKRFTKWMEQLREQTYIKKLL